MRGRTNHPRQTIPDDPPGAEEECRQSVMFAVDIPEFSGRPAHEQRRLRKFMYTLIEEAYEHTKLDRDRCIHEDRGDGMFVIAEDAPCGRILIPLIEHLATGLEDHNRNADESLRFKLRMAVHSGFFQRDEHGVTSPDLIHLFRLLDAPALKAHVRDHPAALALIVSDFLYEKAVSYDLVDQSDYRCVLATVKETRTHAWIEHPGHGRPCPGHRRDLRDLLGRLWSSP
jgi:hypothetical protein